MAVVQGEDPTQQEKDLASDGIGRPKELDPRALADRSKANRQRRLRGEDTDVSEERGIATITSR